jgi:hypothetical protein
MGKSKVALTVCDGHGATGVTYVTANVVNKTLPQSGSVAPSLVLKECSRDASDDAIPFSSAKILCNSNAVLMTDAVTAVIGAITSIPIANVNVNVLHDALTCK